MNKLIVLALATSLAACASDTASRRPAASARTEPTPEQRRQSERASQGRDLAATETPVAPVRSSEVEGTRGVEPVAVAGAPAATDQSNSSSDIENTRKVRQAVSDDASLSFAAKNVTIVSNQGEITLRGKVKNEQEKRAIESYARQTVGAGHVHNQLDVEP